MPFLVVRSALFARVSNHENAAILRDAANWPLLRMRTRENALRAAAFRK
jgi:hypothetical protein